MGTLKRWRRHVALDDLSTHIRGTIQRSEVQRRWSFQGWGGEVMLARANGILGGHPVLVTTATGTTPFSLFPFSTTKTQK